MGSVRRGPRCACGALKRLELRGGARIAPVEPGAERSTPGTHLDSTRPNVTDLGKGPTSRSLRLVVMSHVR